MTLIEWVDSPEHPWNNFGTPVVGTPSLDDDLKATALILRKKTTLKDLVEGIVESLSTGAEVLADPNLLTGFSLVITLAHLSPFQIKLIGDDSHAKLFLDLLKTEGDTRYFDKSSLQEYTELNPLISRFLNDGILVEENDRYIVSTDILADVKLGI